MRICHLSGEILGAHHGGAVHTREVARAFHELGHEVLLVAPGDASDLPIRHLSCPMRRGPVSSTWAARRHESAILEFQPDLIYERQLVGGGFGGRLGRRLGVPVVYEVNSPHLDEYLHRFFWLKPFAPLLRWRQCRQFSACDLVVTTHDTLVPRHFQGRSLVGPWAVRACADSEGLPPWDRLDDRAVILVAGSFREWHGLQRIEEIARALGDGPWALVLLGGGQLREQLARRLDDLPFPVVDGGTLPPEKMTRAYRGARLLLAPFDPPLPGWPFYYSPFKILEALACGLPVITDAADNLKILLDESWCGRAMATQDPAFWAQGCRELLDAPKPNPEQAAAYADRHSWRRHCEAILEAVAS